MRCDGGRLIKLAAEASEAPEGVAPGEVGAEDDDAVVNAFAHVQRARRHAQALRTCELSLAVAWRAVRLAHGAEVRAVGEAQLLNAVVVGVGHVERGAVALHAAREVKLPGTRANITDDAR